MRRKGKVMIVEDGRERVRRRGKPLVMPPPESTVWPEQCRGKNWKRVYWHLFKGRCQLCMYSFGLPKSRQMLDKWHGETRLVLCTNHPACPGELREVLPTDTCRNYKPKWWRPPRSKPAPRHTVVADESDPTVRRIPLGNGVFATVDAGDYEELSKYKWYAYRFGHTVYAACRIKGRQVYMHRMLMRPRKGYVVDHIDRNGLNNRRSNLRVVTPRQNRANAGPCGGTSQYVGVYRRGDKWVAGITAWGKHHCAGTFDDEVEAAKARDRVAWELHGERAYLNFPEDFRH